VKNVNVGKLNSFYALLWKGKVRTGKHGKCREVGTSNFTEDLPRLPCHLFRRAVSLVTQRGGTGDTLPDGAMTQTTTHNLTHRRRWRTGYRASRLLRLRAELVALRRAGASYPALATWLRAEHRIRVAHTTILRFLRSLPEMQASVSPDTVSDGLHG